MDGRLQGGNLLVGIDYDVLGGNNINAVERQVFLNFVAVSKLYIPNTY